MESRDLFEVRKVLKASMADLKDQLKEVEEKLSSTYLPKAKELLGYDGKDFGTINIFHGNDTIKAVLSKKVTWDQDMLRSALETMSEEDARHYGKLTFAVEERKFTAAPPTIQRVLEECRTTDVGRFTIEIEED
jgi:hypothetical protein